MQLNILIIFWIIRREQMIEKHWAKWILSLCIWILSLWAWNVCKFDPLFKKKSLGSEIEIKDVSVVLSERLSRSEHHKFQVSVNKMSTRWQTSNIPHTCAPRQKSLTGVEELVSTRWKEKKIWNSCECEWEWYKEDDSARNCKHD